MEKPSPLKAVTITIVTSALVIVFLFWLIYFKTPGVTDAKWVDYLPALNALLNSICGMCLICGFIAIKRGLKKLHISLMISATVVTLAFLVSYITYHHFHGDTQFLAEGGIKYFYFALLISHIVLSVVVLPLVLLTLFFATTKRFGSHKKIARWTFPIWLYVDVTGVLVYLILNNCNVGP